MGCRLRLMTQSFQRLGRGRFTTTRFCFTCKNKEFTPFLVFGSPIHGLGETVCQQFETREDE